MDRNRSIALSGDVMTSTGSLNFFNSQYSFDIIFDDDPAMLILILRKKGQCATENTVYLISKVNEFCNLCRLHVFCDSAQLKYVGTDVYDSQKMLANISPAPSKIKMVYSGRGKIFLSPPMAYFINFTAFLPLLSLN